jgi:hypothetical protein
MVVSYFKDKTRVLLVIILYDKTFSMKVHN